MVIFTIITVMMMIIADVVDKHVDYGGDVDHDEIKEETEEENVLLPTIVSIVR